MEIVYAHGIRIESGDSSQYPEKSWGSRPKSQVNKPSDFIALTSRDLKIIASKPIGKDLLELISKRNQGIGTSLNKGGTGKTVTITNGFGTLTKGDYNTAASSSESGKFSVMKTVSAGYEMRMAGAGANVKISYNPKQNYTALLKLNTPSYVALAHELVHAWHWMSGNFDSSNMKKDFITGLYACTLKEEAYTVGAGTYKNTRISENAIRKEHGLVLRQYYNVQGDCNLGEIQADTRPRR
jgi:hypothetical protein